MIYKEKLVVIEGILFMGKWFNIIKDSEYFKEFMEMFYAFHDYRIDKIIYDASQNQVDVVFEYDITDCEKIMLRFIGISAMHINTDIDYEAGWLSGTELADSNLHQTWNVFNKEIHRDFQVFEV